jgi:hypothetical protein
MEEKIINFNLSSKWCLYYHDLNSNDWSIESYKKIMEIIDYEKLIFMLNRFENINCGMFFLMKNDIKPTYEDDSNKNGGYWSLRISKKETSEIWKKIIYYLVIEGILENKNDESLINGISIGPKINNCIFKIWNGDFKKFSNNSLRSDIDIFKNNDIFYLEHKDK